jgi:hypothetical protein
MNLNQGTLATLITAAALLGGFYYTTQHRLDDLETQMSQLSQQIQVLKKQRKTRTNKKK